MVDRGEKIGHNFRLMSDAVKKLSPRIVSDPKIQGGEPCFAGTRIMVRPILDLLEAGYTSLQVIEDGGHHFTEQDIEEALSIREVIFQLSDEIRARAEARIERELSAVGIVGVEAADVKV